jgi:hypothetical protein
MFCDYRQISKMKPSVEMDLNPISIITFFIGVMVDFNHSDFALRNKISIYHTKSRINASTF